jgi:hypothetical protein
MTLLCSPKVTHHHGHLGGVLPPGKSAFLPQGKCCAGWPCRPWRSIVSPAHAVSSRNLSRLRAFGTEDGKSPRTPSAWMMSLAPPLALRQIVFFVWVSLSEQKWVILAERRGVSGSAGSRSAVPAIARGVDSNWLEGEKDEETKE